MGGGSEWIKCLIPTARPPCPAGMGSGRGPLPFPPPTRRPPVIAGLPSELERWGPPRSWPEGQSWAPCSPAARSGMGVGSGEASRPSLASSASALHPGATPPPWRLPAQRGAPVCTFISPPPKWGTAGVVHQSWAPREERRPGTHGPHEPGWGVGALVWGGGSAPRGGPLWPCGGPPIC